MFTLKQIVRDGNKPQDMQVRLYEGRNPHLEVNPQTKEPQVGFTMDDGTYCTIDTGLLYVMNGQGKTVETFRLAGSETF